MGWLGRYAMGHMEDAVTLTRLEWMSGQASTARPSARMHLDMGHENGVLLFLFLCTAKGASYPDPWSVGQIAAGHSAENYRCDGQEAG